MMPRMADDPVLDDGLRALGMMIDSECKHEPQRSQTAVAGYVVPEEVDGADLGEEFAGYVFRIQGGMDK